MQISSNELVLRDVSIGYKFRRGKVKTVRTGLSVCLIPGQLTCLLGLNGAGKSTLLRTMCRFQDPLSGSVSLGNRNLNSFSASELSSKVAVVLTERTSGSGLTVREVVSLGRYHYTGYFGTLTEGDERVIDAALEAVGMEGYDSEYMSGLSDGERQKILIAKAVAQESPVIILDEPTSFLDVSSRMEMFILLRNLAHKRGKSILLSTHDVELARRFADIWWLMGKDAFHVGTPDELIDSGTAAALFNRGDIRVF